MKKNYKQRYLQTILNTITYEKNNLIKLKHKEVSINKRDYRFNKYEKDYIQYAIWDLEQAIDSLTEIKGIEK